MIKSHEIKPLALWILVAQLAGILGSMFTASSLDTWYMGLAMPSFTPPAWIFGPVWTILFTLMGIAAYLVWKKGTKRKDVRWALGLFFLQLVLNVYWSYLFFGLNRIDLAMKEIVALWLAIFVTGIAFHRVSSLASLLLIPYIAWVSFAGYLNYSFMQVTDNVPSDGFVCTQEAKQCPDGTYVGRTGPKCAFEACPGN